MKLMKLIEVVVSFSKKINLGNYESKDVFTSVKAFIETQDSLAAVIDALLAECKAAVQRETGNTLTERAKQEYQRLRSGEVKVKP